MANVKLSGFEIVLLIVGVTAAFLGFQMINQVYSRDGILGWNMVIAIFAWLILLVLFISLSVAVDVSKKQLTELRNISAILGQKKGKK